jgi:hypothetical protein
VSRASEVLSDPARRRAYDQFGVDDDAGGGIGGDAFGGFAGPAAAAGGASRNARRRRRPARPGAARQRGPVNLEEELDDLLNSMSPEQVFEFLFTAAGAGVPGGRGGVFREFGGGFGGPAAEPAEADTASLWARYKPLTLLVALAFFLMMLGGGVDEVRFSLRETLALDQRRVSPCGVDFFVSRFHGMDRKRPEEVERLHAAVHREAASLLGGHCVQEREEYARLLRGSTAWIATQSSRERYARRAEGYRARATMCTSWESLVSCAKEQEQLVRAQRR